MLQTQGGVAQKKRGSMRIVCVCLVFLWIVGSAHAQLVVGQGSGTVGQRVRIPISLEHSVDTLAVHCTIVLSNPTVLYPEQVVVANSDTLLSSRVQRLSDSIHTAEFVLVGATTGVVCYLVGEVLAGSASTCLVTLRDIEANGERWESTEALVTVQSVGTPLPYVRFAQLEQNYPNPARRGQSTTWAYNIDKGSVVQLVLYNLTGKAIEHFQWGYQELGIYRFSYTIPTDMATGLYFARLITSSGNSSQPFVVVP